MNSTSKIAQFHVTKPQLGTLYSHVVSVTNPPTVNSSKLYIFLSRETVFLLNGQKHKGTKVHMPNMKFHSVL
jgi:hypothetical protein